MGRARSHSQAISLSGFGAVVGTRQGSAEAQARRDRDEERARELAQAAVLAARDRTLDAWGRQLALITGHSSCFECLIGHYTADLPNPEVAHERFIAEAVEAVKRYPRECAYAVAHGDPEGCEGLTEPFVSALVRIFEHVTPENAAEVTELAQQTIEVCFYDHLSLTDEYVESQAALAEALSRIIEYHPAAPDYAVAPGPAPVVTAIRVLRIARQSVLDGPLASWVQAFARRERAGRLSAREAELLYTLSPVTRSIS